MKGKNMTDTALEPVTRLRRDLRKAAKPLHSVYMSRSEVRFLVDSYYQLQDDRKRSSAQVRSTEESQEPHEVLQWLSDSSALIERNLKEALLAYSSKSFVGTWAMSLVGIGPVIAAGLEAHIDITQAPTVGHIWSFAGLDPTVEWKPKTKRPWNANLKVLCWKIGESFVKTSGKEKSFYGPLWKERKLLETACNNKKLFADQAQAKLKKYKIGKNTDAYSYYSKGYLPPAHIHARSKRWAVKLFLSHWHHVAWWVNTGEHPVKPYILDQKGGHAHDITVPNPLW